MAVEIRDTKMKKQFFPSRTEPTQGLTGICIIICNFHPFLEVLQALTIGTFLHFNVAMMLRDFLGQEGPSRQREQC